MNTVLIIKYSSQSKTIEIFFFFNLLVYSGMYEWTNLGQIIQCVVFENWRVNIKKLLIIILDILKLTHFSFMYVLLSLQRKIICISHKTYTKSQSSNLMHQMAYKTL
jgi:hypothetical protein